MTVLKSMPYAVLDTLLEGCQIISFDWKYIYVNDVVAIHGRLSKNTLLGKTMMEVYPGIEQTHMFSVLRECMEKRTTHIMENEFAFSDGSKGWFELRFNPVPEGVFILSLEITERKAAEQHIHWLLEHHAATKLPNQTLLLKSIQQILSSTQLSTSTIHALALLSLDNTLEIEATFGVGSTVELMRQLAENARETFNMEQIYHVSTNQLALLIHQPSQALVTQVINILAEVAQKPFMYKTIPLHGDIRIGYTYIDDANKKPETYIQDANTALIKAQETSQYRLLYSGKIENEVRENLALLGELGHALENSHTILHYQPKVEVATGTIHGVEALMRWFHPKLAISHLISLFHEPKKVP